MSANGAVNSTKTPMHEHDDHTPDTIHRLKDTIFAGFRALPPEHQATLSLALTKTVVEGEWGEWLRNAISRLYPPQHAEAALPIPVITRGHLEQSGLTREEISQFSDADLSTVRSLVLEHFLSDVFLDEVTFVADLMLEQKRKESAPPHTP